jgi:molecular chaperone DnaK (HSP70)
MVFPILIFDMGGGTTDVTIARMSEESFGMVVMEGD